MSGRQTQTAHAEADGHAGKAGMASMRHRKRCRGPHVLKSAPTSGASFIVVAATS